MLTTLLLQKWNRMNLKYVPEAHCYTIVPDTFMVLLSQRRRWINSTFHNMLYLLRVTLGGICCFSMKFILILDMIGTLILPSSLFYVALILWNSIWNHNSVSTYTLHSGKRCPKILPEDVLIRELAVDHRQFQPPGWRNRLCLGLARSHERVGL